MPATTSIGTSSLPKLGSVSSSSQATPSPSLVAQVALTPSDGAKSVG
jgi:hypothetical protein